MYIFHGDKRIQIYHVLTPLSTIFSYIVVSYTRTYRLNGRGRRGIIIIIIFFYF